MNIRDAIKKLLKDNYLTQTKISEMLQMSQGDFGNKLRRNDIKISFLLKLTSVLGYEVVIRPKEGLNKAERTIVITNEPNDK